MTAAPATRGTGPSAPDFSVRRYVAAHAGDWEEFVTRAATGTFLHSRRFLGYHEGRFEDRSLVFLDAAGRLQAVMPAALDPQDRRCVVSHPGATYGGLLVTADRATQVPELLDAARAHYASEGIDRLVYRCVPLHLHASPSQVDAWALWRSGAETVRRDLWNVIDLSEPRVVAEERRRHLRRASEAGIRLVRDDSGEAYAAFHSVLAGCLDSRHATVPVHSLAEMRTLHELFPDRIALWLALDDSGGCLAGEWIFDLGHSWHGQYGAASAEGRRISAQDLLLDRIVAAAAQAGRRWFSFGTSTVRAGRELNAGLFRYKASFGTGNALQDFLQIATTRSAEAEPSR